MKPMYLSIRQKETGDQIKRLIKENGYTVRDIQGAMGFENPQAIYKWMAGRSLPSLDNLIILSRLLHISMEDILVVDGDVFFISVRMRRDLERKMSAFADPESRAKSRGRDLKSLPPDRAENQTLDHLYFF